MVLPGEDLPVVVLAPADLVFVRTPHVLITVLGSCVSVTMRHGSLAGMCHAMLPERLDAREVDRETRFLDHAIDHMVRWFTGHGVLPRALEVKAFGGADVLPQLAPEGRRHATVGAQNIRMADTLLERHGLMTRSTDLGGALGRKIYFNTMTGDVFVRLVGSARP